MIYTSYFGNRKVINGVSIAGKQPTGCNWPQYKPFVPSWDLVHDYKNGAITEGEYTRLYIKRFLDMSAKGVYSELIKTYGDGCTLLCWEVPTQFCHRQLVRKWFTSQGLKCEEL